MQRDAIERAAQARGAVIDTWFAEKVGGAAPGRPQLEALRKSVQAGFYERVFVYRLDRLSRAGIRETMAIVEEFKAHGCRVETVADGFSLEGPAAQIVLAVLAWAAQMERIAIGERISSARVRIEASGGAWGRPKRVDDRTAGKVRTLAKTRTVREIAIALKIPKSTVGAIVSEKGAYARPLARLAKTRP
jgi:DNA invertase Pin-like site-specific DNA recombinase